MLATLNDGTVRRLSFRDLSTAGIPVPPPRMPLTKGNTHMAKKSTLLGKFIHVPGEKGSVEGFPTYTPLEKQGYINAQLTKEDKDKSPLYEVAWFSWATGAMTQSTIVSLEAMHFEAWTFYDDEDDWRSRADEDSQIKHISHQKKWEQDKQNQSN
jgi:hypothetical protein